MITPLKPIPPRYRSGERVRKHRRYAGTIASVYVVECPSAGTVKVGYSTSPSIRMRNLQTEIGQALFLRWHGETTREKAALIEKTFHDANKSKVVHAVGEWYVRSAEAAISEILGIARTLGIELSQHGRVETLKGADVYEAERARCGQVAPVPLDANLIVTYSRL